MNRRYAIAIGSAVAMLMIGSGAWLLWPESAVTPENALRIQPGMALTEVEEILGGPALADRWGPAFGPLAGGDEWREWRTLSVRIFITFQDGRVQDVAVRNYSRLSLAEKLTRWWQRV